jgi:hypothetical protein
MTAGQFGSQAGFSIQSVAERNGWVSDFPLRQRRGDWRKGYIPRNTRCRDQDDWRDIQQSDYAQLSVWRGAEKAA